MPWSSPVNPTPGTVITAAQAIANWIDQVRWLRLLTGNADPPGTAYVVVSDSVSGASWKKVPGDAIADGAVSDAKLAVAKLNRAGDATTGDLYVTRAGGATGYLILGNNAAYFVGFDGSQLSLRAPSVAVPSDLYVYRNAAQNTGYLILGNNPAHFIGFDGTNVTTETGKVWTVGNDGPGSGLDADVLDGQHGAFYQGRANHTGTQLASTISPQGAGSGLNADTLRGAAPSGAPTANAIPIADPSGHLDAWVTPSGLAGVPAGLICGFAGGAAAIPTGWTRYSLADGRLLVGAGTFSGSEHTFTENNSYGNTWAHQHASNSFGFSVNLSGGTALSVSASGTLPATTGGPSATNGLAAPGGTSLPTDNHTHTLGGSVAVGGSATGTISGAATGPTTGATLLLPMRAVPWIVKS